ncbi:hypothetical protein C8Q76DRAFT_598731, partial [Earliella scabrosa]
IRHPRYYFEDGNLYVLVDDLLFNLHRSLLCNRGSNSGSSHDSSLHWEGRSEQQPLRLRDVRVAAFELFLSLIYPSVILGEATLPRCAEDWISILDQSDQWGCNRIRLMAIEQLQGLSMDPVLKIAIWTKYRLDVSEIASSYHALGTRTQPLTLAEGRMLEPDTVVKLAALRDRVHQG